MDRAASNWNQKFFRWNLAKIWKTSDYEGSWRRPLVTLGSRVIHVEKPIHSTGQHTLSHANRSPRYAATIVLLTDRRPSAKVTKIRWQKKNDRKTRTRFRTAQTADANRSAMFPLYGSGKSSYVTVIKFSIQWKWSYSSKTSDAPTKRIHNYARHSGHNNARSSTKSSRQSCSTYCPPPEECIYSSKFSFSSSS